MGRRYQVISADGHLEVPPGMWDRRVPDRFKDLAPRLVTHYDGSQWWHILGGEHENQGNLVAGLDYDQALPHTIRTFYDQDGSPRPGCGDARQRLREQDAEGLDAEVLFPPFFIGRLLAPLVAVDRAAYRAIVRAYNDFLAEDFCAKAPDRLIGSALVPLSGVEDAIAEISHIRKQGLRSATLLMWPNGGPTYKRDDDTFFAACLDLDVKLSPHGSFGGPAEDKRIVELTTGTSEGGHFITDCVQPIAQLIYCGVFDRFPELKFYFAETDASWIPFMLNWLDELYIRQAKFKGVELRMPPSAYVRDRCRFSFITDGLAVKYRHHIGLDLLMWGTDHPHGVGLVPHTQDYLDDFFDGVSPTEVRQILVDNPCRFFGLDPEADLTPTPA